MGLGGQVRCRTTMLWKPVWFPHQTRPLGPLICWVVCVLGDTCLLPQSSLLPAPHFLALLSCVHPQTTETPHLHHVTPGDIKHADAKYTSDVCVCVCVLCKTMELMSTGNLTISGLYNYLLLCISWYIHKCRMSFNKPHSNEIAVQNIFL